MRPLAQALLDEADQQQFLAVADDRLDRDAQADLLAGLLEFAAGGGDRGGLDDGALDHPAQARANFGMRHGEEVMGRVAGGDVEEALGGTERVQALVFAVDQHGRRGVVLDDEALAQFGQHVLARAELRRAGTGRAAHGFAHADGEAVLAGPVPSDMAVEAGRF